jgi:hypothetical protein
MAIQLAALLDSQIALIKIMMTIQPTRIEKHRHHLTLNSVSQWGMLADLLTRLRTTVNLQADSSMEKSLL